MVINALNCGAKVFMADFEDANAPSWENMVRGQINLRDAIDRSITFTNPDGRFYQLNEQTATLLARPRGWLTFICQSWRIAWKRAFGMMSSFMPRRR